jgi:ribosomal protein S18 acetylase RimI-like enzyme
VITPDRLEGYLRRAVGSGRETVKTPPFVIFLDPQDPLRFFNYARPLESITGDLELLRARLTEPLAALRAVFVSRQRTPRFEYVEEFAPDLAAVLDDAGLTQEGRYPLLVCDAESYRVAPRVRGLEIQLLTVDSCGTDLRDFVVVERYGFGHRVTEEVTEVDCEDLRDEMRRGSLALLARLDGQSVGIASCTVPLDGLTELTGIATLPEYRRRGVATAITAAAAHAAFGYGVDAAFLTAGDEQAGRVYQRVGFRPYATTLSYWDPTLS